MGQPKYIILLLSFLALLAGCQPATQPFECTDRIGCVDIALEAPIEIGVLQVLSGELDYLGVNNLRQMELALNDRDHQFLGHPIEIQIEDSLCSPEGGATAAAKIIANSDIVGIVGPTCSGAAASAMKIVSNAGLVMISGSSTASSLTSVGGKPGRDWYPGFFRTAQNDAETGRVAATFTFEQLDLSKAATLDDGDPYTQGLTATFNQVFTELGGEVVLVAGVNKGDKNMQPVLSAIAQSGANLLFFVLFLPEGDYLITQAREMQEMENVILLSAEGLYQDNFIKAMGEDGKGLHFVIPTSYQGADIETFFSRFVTEYGEEPIQPYYAHTYDATNLLLDAIERVVIEDLDGTLHIGRQALRDALYATSGHPGITGRLTCDEFGDCSEARFQVVRLDDPAAGLEGLAANVIFTYPPDQ